MVKGEPVVEILIPASRLTRVTAQSLANVLADSPRGIARIVVFLDAEIKDSETERIQFLFADSVEFIESGGTQRGPAWARNELARLAHAPFIVFADSDVLIPPQFVSRILPLLSDAPKGSVIAPRIEPLYPTRSMSRFFSRFILSPSVVDGRVVAPTTTLALSRTTWLASEPFDERFQAPGGEDWDWMIRNNRKTSGFSVRYVPQLSVQHDDPRSIWGVLRRAWKYGSQERLIYTLVDDDMSVSNPALRESLGTHSKMSSWLSLLSGPEYWDQFKIVLWKDYVLTRPFEFVWHSWRFLPPQWVEGAYHLVVLQVFAAVARLSRLFHHFGASGRRDEH